MKKEACKRPKIRDKESEKTSRRVALQPNQNQKSLFIYFLRADLATVYCEGMPRCCPFAPGPKLGTTLSDVWPTGQGMVNVTIYSPVAAFEPFTLENLIFDGDAILLDE